jgi:hypothetical protein
MTQARQVGSFLSLTVVLAGTICAMSFGGPGQDFGTRTDTVQPAGPDPRDATSQARGGHQPEGAERRRPSPRAAPGSSIVSWRS